MTDTGTASSGGSMVRLFAVSLIVGVLLGIATSVLFLLIIGVPLLGIYIGAIGLRGEPRDVSYTAAGAGLLLGSGGVYLYGALNTLISCYGSSVCGGASALPFLAWAVVIVTVGVVLAGVTFTFARRT